MQKIYVKEVEKILFEKLDSVFSEMGFSSKKKNIPLWRKPLGWGEQIASFPVARRDAGYIASDLEVGFYDPIIHAKKMPGPDYKDSATYGTLLRRLVNPSDASPNGSIYNSNDDVLRDIPRISALIKNLVAPYFEKYQDRKSILESMMMGNSPGDFKSIKEYPYMIFYLRGLEEGFEASLKDAISWKAEREKFYLSIGEKIRPALFIEINAVIEFLSELKDKIED